MQTQMRIFNQLPKPEMVSDSLFANCKDGKEAILLCIDARKVRYPLSDIANSLGIDKGHFSRILSGAAHFPDAKRTDLMTLCGNLIPLQFEAKQMGFKLEKPSEKELKIKKLKQELLSLEAS